MVWLIRNLGRGRGIDGGFQRDGQMLMLLYLFGAHALCDYPLQGEFLSKGKNHLDGIPGVPWYQCMIAHCLIHACAVALITQNWRLGMLEFFVHFVIDFVKCEGAISFDGDQALHYFFKIVWWIVTVK